MSFRTFLALGLAAAISPVAFAGDYQDEATNDTAELQAQIDGAVEWLIHLHEKVKKAEINILQNSLRIDNLGSGPTYDGRDYLSSPDVSHWEYLNSLGNGCVTWTVDSVDDTLHLAYSDGGNGNSCILANFTSFTVDGDTSDGLAWTNISYTTATSSVSTDYTNYPLMTRSMPHGAEEYYNVRGEQTGNFSGGVHQATIDIDQTRTAMGLAAVTLGNGETVEGCLVLKYTNLARVFRIDWRCPGIGLAKRINYSNGAPSEMWLLQTYY